MPAFGQVPSFTGVFMEMAYHVTPVENLDSILRDGLRPVIGDRSLALGEPAPRIYLFPSRDDCDTALSSWLGDCFEDVEEDGLVILAVNVEGLALESEVEYELACTELIVPERIVDVLDEGWAKKVVPGIGQGAAQVL